MFEFDLKVKLETTDIKLPTRANHDDAGMDVYSPIDVDILPRGDSLISLGFSVEFPKGYALIFKEKSGRATKNKLDVGACVVDAGYRGIVHAHLINNSDNVVSIKKGEKISQFLIVPVWQGNCIEVANITNDTTRGSGGFGSTGTK